ncbi:hypothetical protein ACFFR8_23665 [Streptoalloteichus tenebrarius]|nr:hypothetical protein [Streptoalloteichus tenebrarius]
MAEVDDIQFYELRARLLEEPDPAHDGEHDAAGVEQRPKAAFRVMLDGSLLGFRLRLSVRSVAAEYVADAAAFFRLAEPVAVVEASAMNAFIEKEAFPVLYPFVRQSVFDLASKMGVETVLLGLTRPEDMDFTVDLAPPDAAYVENADVVSDE